MPTSAYATSSEHNADLIQTPKRRRACEHCRAQKLKCIRDESNLAGSCFRCIDARKECVTDTRRRVGRPPRYQPSNRQPQWDVASAQNDVGPQEVSFYPSLDLFDTSGSATWAADDFSMDSLSADMYELADLPSSFGSSLSAFFLDSTTQPKQDSSVGSSASTSDDQVAGEIEESGPESELQLLQLQQDLMNLVIRLRKHHWDIMATLNVRLQSGTGSTDDSEGDLVETESTATPTTSDSDFNPLTATFDLVAKFDQLLREKLQSIHVRRSQSATQTANRVSSHISSQYLLGVIACYMHILSAYDCIVSCVLDGFARNATVKDFILFGAPRLTIAGTLAPPIVNTLGQLLVKVLETKILPVELNLGLPDGLRISKDNSGMQNIRAFSLLGGAVAGKSVLNILEDAKLESHNGDTQYVGMRTLRERMDLLHGLKP